MRFRRIDNRLQVLRERRHICITAAPSIVCSHFNGPIPHVPHIFRVILERIDNSLTRDASNTAAKHRRIALRESRMHELCKIRIDCKLLHAHLADARAHEKPRIICAIANVVSADFFEIFYRGFRHDAEPGLPSKINCKPTGHGTALAHLGNSLPVAIDAVCRIRRRHHLEILEARRCIHGMLAACRVDIFFASPRFVTARLPRDEQLCRTLAHVQRKIRHRRDLVKVELSIGIDFRFPVGIDCPRHIEILAQTHVRTRCSCKCPKGGSTQSRNKRGIQKYARKLLFFHIFTPKT